MKEYLKKISDKVNLFGRNISKESHQIKEPLTKEEIRKIMAEEKEKGLATRCEWCPDNIFCDAYLNHVKKNPDEIPRCDDFYSGR